MIPRGRSSLAALLIVVAVVVVGAATYSRALRYLFLPAELAYLPQEWSWILATGEIEQVWDGVDLHFGRVLREQERGGMLFSFLAGLRDELAARDTPIASLADLGRYGLDVTRGALVGVYLHGGEPLVVAALPIRDRAAFVAFLAAGAEPDAADCLADVEGGAGAVVAEPFISAFPEPGLAVISPSCELLADGLASRDANLTYARQQDDLLDAVRQWVRRPLLSGSGFFAYARQLAPPPFPAATAALAGRLETASIQVDGELTMQGAGAQLLRKVLAAPRSAHPWRDYVGSDTAAVALVRDGATAHYLDLASRIGDLGAAMRDWFGGVLFHARLQSGLEQLLLAAPGYREGLPQLLLGLWGDGPALDEFVAALRVRLREERDLAVLRGARAAFQERNGGNAAASVDALLASGDLLEEPGSLFQRYHIVDGEVRAASLVPQDLETATYQRDLGRLAIRYLAPAVTENDLRYRIDRSGLSERDLDLLRANRFRLASVRIGDVLWLATDEQDLVEVVERVDSPAAPGAKTVAPAGRTATNTKLEVALSVPSLIEQGLLSGDSDVLERIETVLFDFRFHPTVKGRIDVLEQGQGLRVMIEAERPPAAVR